MTRIAQLSDLHLVEDDHARRRGLPALRLRYLSFGRAIDAVGRRERLRRALASVTGAGADHVVVTGDLTEDGTMAQFEVLAEVLAESRVDPRAVTLLPGNHDAYDDLFAFERALDGPLRAFRHTSAAGSATLLDDAVVVPLSTRIAQPFTRSAGRVSVDALGRVDAIAKDPAALRRAVVVAQHHPAHPRPLKPYNWIDGTENASTIEAAWGAHAHVHVLHGHTHFREDRPLGAHDHARVFSPTAVVDSELPLRLYDACAGRLTPVTMPPSPAQSSRAVARAPLAVSA